MQIECPHCGSRDLREFTYVGDASRQLPELSDEETVWGDYVYSRTNPKGDQSEFWQHSHGCRQFLRIMRNTVTHRISDIQPVGPYCEAPA